LFSLLTPKRARYDGVSIKDSQAEYLTSSEVAELTVIRDENEQLFHGDDCKVLCMDTHALHIREHYALLNATNDEQAECAILSHLMEHSAYQRGLIA